MGTKQTNPTTELSIEEIIDAMLCNLRAELAVVNHAVANSILDKDSVQDDFGVCVATLSDSPETRSRRRNGRCQACKSSNTLEARAFTILGAILVLEKLSRVLEGKDSLPAGLQAASSSGRHNGSHSGRSTQSNAGNRSRKTEGNGLLTGGVEPSTTAPPDLENHPPDQPQTTQQAAPGTNRFT